MTSGIGKLRRFNALGEGHARAIANAQFGRNALQAAMHLKR